MSRRSVTKGKAGEREACAVLADALPGLQRTYGQSRGGHEAADIDALGCPYRIEVKVQKNPNPGTAYEQALEDARDADDNRELLVITKADRRPWLVTITATEFVRLRQPHARETS